jgi:hypothetical protein
MATHTNFGNANATSSTGSQYPVGTAFLRQNPTVGSVNTAWITLGKCEKISVKTTGQELSLEDENGETEAYLMFDNGEDVSLTARFTRDVPSPKKGQLISLVRRKSVAVRSTRPYTVVATASGKSKFTMALTTGYSVGELITVVSSSAGGYAGQTVPVLAVSAGDITLDVLFTVTATGTLQAPISTGFTWSYGNTIDTFLISDVSESYGSKEVPKYDLTAKRWESISIDTGGAVATVNTATGALTSKELLPDP